MGDAAGAPESLGLETRHRGRAADRPSGGRATRQMAGRAEGARGARRLGFETEGGITRAGRGAPDGRGPRLYGSDGRYKEGNLRTTDGRANGDGPGLVRQVRPARDGLPVPAARKDGETGDDPRRPDLPGAVSGRGQDRPERHFPSRRSPDRRQRRRRRVSTRARPNGSHGAFKVQFLFVCRVERACSCTTSAKFWRTSSPVGYRAGARLGPDALPRNTDPRGFGRTDAAELREAQDGLRVHESLFSAGLRGAAPVSLSLVRRGAAGAR